MRVLVTGATWGVGAALVRRLVEEPGVELVLAVGRDGADPPVSHARLAYRVADLGRARAVHDLVMGDARAHAIDRVFHADENALSSLDLVHACTNHPTIRRLVYRSFAEVYALGHTTANIIDEDSRLDFDPTSPRWVRHRVEADTALCARMHGPLSIAVLRFAEVFAAGARSQLWDYARSRVCLRPLGFDPMINVLSMEDAVEAALAALRSTAVGVFNIPGADTLPLSAVIAECHRMDIPVPGPLLAPLYSLRTSVTGLEFRYDLNFRRFHFGAVLDGTRAHEQLGFTPQFQIHWPAPWWQQFAAKLRG